MLAPERLLLATHNMPRDMQWTVQRHAQMLASPRLRIALPCPFQVTTASKNSLLRATLWHATRHALKCAATCTSSCEPPLTPLPPLPCLSLCASDHGSTGNLWHATLHAVLHNAIHQFFATLLTVPPFPSLPLPCAVLHNATHQFFAVPLTLPCPALPLPPTGDHGSTFAGNPLVCHTACSYTTPGTNYFQPLLQRPSALTVPCAGDHGSTFAGNPLVCHTACTVFDIINSPDFLKSVTAKGEKLKEGE